MTRGTSLVAVGLTTLLVLSVLAVGGHATERQAPTQITECTTINESGNYELTADITYEGSDACINVDADDVTIDGNGHAITFNKSTNPRPSDGAAISVENQTNVTIRDITLNERADFRVTDSTAVTLANNRINAPAELLHSQDLTIQDNHFSTTNVEIQFVQDLQITNNRLADARINVIDDAANVTVRDNHGQGQLHVRLTHGDAIVTNNTISKSGSPQNDRGTAISVSGEDGTSLKVARNDVANGHNGLTASADGDARVHNNTIKNMSNLGLHLGGTSKDFRVTHNTITDADTGVSITGGYDTGPALTLEHNSITDNRIGIYTYSNLPEIHRNDLSANTEYGAFYTQDNGVANATHNYWGDRPASPEDEHAPFEDPVTEALANGSGSAVSEGAAPAGAEEGISNVHFDPWLDTAPNAGVQQPSDGDDTSDDTTTTTSDTTTATTTSDDTTTTASDDTTTTASDDTTTTTSDETTTSDDTTTTTSDETNTTSATPTTNQSTIITGTTASEAPGFGPLSVLLALIGSALLAARHT